MTRERPGLRTQRSSAPHKAVRLARYCTTQEITIHAGISRSRSEKLMERFIDLEGVGNG